MLNVAAPMLRLPELSCTGFRNRPRETQDSGYESPASLSVRNRRENILPLKKTYPSLSSLRYVLERGLSWCLAFLQEKF